MRQGDKDVLAKAYRIRGVKNDLRLGEDKFAFLQPLHLLVKVVQRKVLTEKAQPGIKVNISHKEIHVCTVEGGSWR